MNDRSQSHDRVLTLLCERGAGEVLQTLRTSGGATTFAQLVTCGSRHPGRLLRALAAEGLVSRSVSGSWDSDPGLRAAFTLTDEGNELAERLGRLSGWARQRTERDHPHRRQYWLRRWV
ncbi:MAG: hypothetical protein JXA67_21835 [Micromonosporaceae bacterium]|nr:hypothetical protein [Micromonosporaceae bacterium]